MSERYRVYSEPPYVVVQVDDWELSDWFDDILTEGHGLEIELFRDGLSGSRELMISESVSIRRIRSILEAIDSDEIERVFRLNNP